MTGPCIKTKQNNIFTNIYQINTIFYFCHSPRCGHKVLKMLDCFRSAKKWDKTVLNLHKSRHFKKMWQKHTQLVHTVVVWPNIRCILIIYLKKIEPIWGWIKKKGRKQLQANLTIWTLKTRWLRYRSCCRNTQHTMTEIQRLA